MRALPLRFGLALALIGEPALAQASASVAAKQRLSLNDAVPGKDGIKRALVLRGLDKITGRPTNIFAPIGVPVDFASLTITAHYCYSTPPSEPPETTAFVQITDHRPDQPAKQVFSGWMHASSPSLNGSYGSRDVASTIASTSVIERSSLVKTS